MTDPIQVSSDVTIEFPPSIDFIPTARLMLRRALPQLDADDDGLYFGAITEILANAVQAHDELPDRPVRVDVALRDRPSVTITDEGAGFDPDNPLPPKRPGGHGNGLRIARSACPDMTINSSAAGTSVTLPFGPGPRR